MEAPLSVGTLGLLLLRLLLKLLFAGLELLDLAVLTTNQVILFAKQGLQPIDLVIVLGMMQTLNWQCVALEPVECQ
jgi:hypothetical protein